MSKLLIYAVDDIPSIIQYNRFLLHTSLNEQQTRSLLNASGHNSLCGLKITSPTLTIEPARGWLEVLGAYQNAQAAKIRPRPSLTLVDNVHPLKE